MTMAAPSPSESNLLLSAVRQSPNSDDDVIVECQAILQEALDGFKAELSPFEVGEFSTATPEQVKRKLLLIQHDQEQRKELRGLIRMQQFVEKIGVFDDFCTRANVWGDGSSILSPWIWGPVLFILKVSSEDIRVLDDILGAYRSFGKCIPPLDRYDESVMKKPQVVRCLAVMYFDLLKFHQRVVKLLHGKGWKKTFGPQWRDYQSDLKATLLNFETHSVFLEIVSESSTPQPNEVAILRIDGDVERSGYDRDGVQRLFDQMPDFKDIAQRLNELCLVHEKRNEVSEDREALLHAEVLKDIRKQLNDHVHRSVDDRHVLEHLLTIFKQLRKSVMDQFEDQKAERKASQMDRVLKWLLPPGKISQASRHEGVCATKQAPGAGSWITEKKVIFDWLHEEAPEFCLVWLNGKMGAGKTILASHIITMCLDQDPRFITNYFYCRENDENQNSSLAVLQTILWQMARRDDDLLPVCDDKREAGRQESLDEIKVVKQLLERYCESEATHQFVIIDGLDECKPADRETIVSFWMYMVDKVERYKPGKLRVLLISRDMADIRDMLQLSISTKIMDLDPADTNQDIEGYLEWVAPRLQLKFGLSDAQKRDFLGMICKRADGMFLYASLTVENLLEQPNQAYYEDELIRSLPESLAQAYVRIIDRLKQTLNANRWNMAQDILRWLAGSMRPMRWYELQAALTIQSDSHGATIDYARNRLRDDIRDLCGPLVRVIEEEGEPRLEFAHSTTREYIRAETKHEGLDGNAIDADLACKCLSYLAMECFRPDLDEEQRKYYAQHGYYGLQDYAVSEWGHHMQQLIAQTAPMVWQRSEESETSTRKLVGALQRFLQAYPEIGSGGGDSDIPNIDPRLLQVPTLPHPLSRHSSADPSSASPQSFSGSQDDESSTELPQPSPRYGNVSLSPSPSPTPSFTLPSTKPDPSGDPKAFCEPFKGIPELYYPILQLWTHIYSHQRHVDSKQREKASLPQLRNALELTRKAIQSLEFEEEPMPGQPPLHFMYGQTLYKCDRVLCQHFFEGFATVDALKRHLNRHERPYHCNVFNCTVAPFGFAHKKDCERHVRNYHAENAEGLDGFATGIVEAANPEEREARYTFVCTFGTCTKKFTRQVNLNAHLDTHNGMRRFECTFCVKTFTRANDRRRHEKIHKRRRGDR
ncbi:C2H2 finger domain transcription factor crzA [Apiospora arundinis]|uniref:C2H2 finger domain transcription factor crzA n=1 Tax=Apiospora arundinis TaxID=335852 RepID=A0ABR2IVU2_9PEZI